jgi:hypothetical protein
VEGRQALEFFLWGISFNFRDLVYYHGKGRDEPFYKSWDNSVVGYASFFLTIAE